MSKVKTQNCVDPEVERIINDSFFYSNSKERFKILNTTFQTHQQRLSLYEEAQDNQSEIFPQEELTEVYLFSEVKPDKVNDICNNGIGCGNVLFSQIGDNKKGVCISRCADLLDEENWKIGHVGVIVVFKCSLKLVKEIENDRCQIISPSSGYDGHVSWNWSLYSPFKKTQVVEKCSFGHYNLYYASQYYFYQFNDADDNEECVPDSTCIIHPRHVLPYAIVDFKIYQASSILNIRSPSQCKPCFKVWEGELVHPTQLSGFSVCLKSFKHAATPVALEQLNVVFEPMDNIIKTNFPEGNIKATAAMELDYFKMIGSDEKVFKEFMAMMKKNSDVATQTISDQVMVIILPSCKFTVNMAIERGKNVFCPESNLHCFILFKKPSSSKDRFNDLRNWKFKVSSPNNVYKIPESKIKKINKKENVPVVSMDENLVMSSNNDNKIAESKIKKMNDKKNVSAVCMDKNLEKFPNNVYKITEPKIENMNEKGNIPSVTIDENLAMSFNNVYKIPESKIKKMNEKENVPALSIDENLAMSPQSLLGLQPEKIDVFGNASTAYNAASPELRLVETVEEVMNDDFRLYLSSDDEDSVNDIDATPVRCEVSALNTELSTNTVEELLSASFIFKDDLVENVTAEDISIKELVSKLIDDVLLKEAAHQEIQPLHLACQSSDPENDNFEMIMLTSAPNSKTIDCEHYSRGNWRKLSTESQKSTALKISFLKINDKWILKNGTHSTLVKRTKQVKNGGKVSSRKRKLGQSSSKTKIIDSIELPHLSLNNHVDQNKVSTLNEETFLDKNRSPVETIISSNVLPTLGNQSSFQVSESFEYLGSFFSQEDKTREFLRVFNVSANGQNSVVENSNGEHPNLKIKSPQKKLQFLQPINLNDNISTKETIIERTGAVQTQIKLLDLSRKEESIEALDLSRKEESIGALDLTVGGNLDNLNNLRHIQTNPRKKVREAGIQIPRQSQKSRMGPSETITIDNDLDYSKNSKKLRHSKSAITSLDQKTIFKNQVPLSIGKSNLINKNFHHSTALSKNLPVTNTTQPFDISSTAGTVSENLINGKIQRNDSSARTNGTQEQKSVTLKQCSNSFISGNNFIRNESQVPNDQKRYLHNTGGKHYVLQRRNISDQLSNLNHSQPINIPLQQSIISGEQNVNLRHENSHISNIIEQPRYPPNYIDRLSNYVSNNMQLSSYHRPPIQSSLNNYFIPNGNIYTNNQCFIQSNSLTMINSNCNFSCSTSRLNDGISQMCSSMVSPTTPSQQSPYLSHSECVTFSESDLQTQINSSYLKVNYLLNINSPLSPPIYPPPSQPPPLPTYSPPAQPLPPPPVFSMDETLVDDFNVLEMELENSSQEDRRGWN